MTAAVEQASWPVSRLFWEGQHTREWGSYFGYSNLVKTLTHCVRHDPSSDLAFRVQDPQNWQPVTGKRNLVLTMWESYDAPLYAIEKYRQAEAIIVPSSFCKKTFDRFADCAVYQIPLAVDSATFTYEKRRLPKDRPFRWLWLNAPDVRKGYEALAKLWQKHFQNRPDFELYMKTTAASGGKVVRVGNVIFDSRVLPKPELVGLYHSAHAFLYPSIGEGFGYTLAEAMSTGLPCVALEYSGVTDFFNPGTGFVAEHTIHRVGLPNNGDKMSNASDGLYEICMPKMASFYEQMGRIYSRYSKAVEIGRRGSRLIEERFNMRTMATGLHDVVAKHQRR
jgi:glycosyltransferase involved in cell wall biosynthesis